MTSRSTTAALSADATSGATADATSRSARRLRTRLVIASCTALVLAAVGVMAIGFTASAASALPCETCSPPPPPPPPPAIHPAIALTDVATSITHCSGQICSTGGDQYNLWVTGTGFGPRGSVRLSVLDNVTGQLEYSATFGAGWDGTFAWQLPFGGCSADGRLVRATASNGASIIGVFLPCAYL